METEEPGTGHRTVTDRFLDAAEAVLLQDGWEGLSVRKVGTRLGLSGPAMYKHFGSKDDLVRQLVGRRYSLFLAYVQEARAALPAPKPVDLLVTDALAYVRYWAENPVWFSLFRAWVTSRHSLAFDGAAPTDVLDEDFASAAGIRSDAPSCRTAIWALRVTLFGFAQAAADSVHGLAGDTDTKLAIDTTLRRIGPVLDTFIHSLMYRVQGEAS